MQYFEGSWWAKKRFWIFNLKYECHDRRNKFYMFESFRGGHKHLLHIHENVFHHRIFQPIHPCSNCWQLPNLYACVWFNSYKGTFICYTHSVYLIIYKLLYKTITITIVHLFSLPWGADASQCLTNCGQSKNQTYGPWKKSTLFYMCDSNQQYTSHKQNLLKQILKHLFIVYDGYFVVLPLIL